jgi:hypothetical protein
MASNDVGWSTWYPYDFYVYKEDENTCPECGRLPHFYCVPSSYHNKSDVRFICASEHKWIASREPYTLDSEV